MRIQPLSVASNLPPFWTIGHRGFPKVAPENTLSSFKAAIRAGADMIEFDVSLTRDKAVVVLHDRTVNRTTNGRGSLAKKSLKAIRDLDAGSWFSLEFVGERVPSLDEVLVQTKGRIALNIEIKMEAVSRQIKNGIEEKVLDAITRMGVRSNTVVSSFLPLVVKRIKHLDQHQSAALLLARPLRQDPRRVVEKVGADALHLPCKALTENVVEKCRREEIPVRVFTVNDVSEMKKMIGWGVNGLFTDCVDRLVALT